MNNATAGQVSSIQSGGSPRHFVFLNFLRRRISHMTHGSGPLAVLNRTRMGPVFWGGESCKCTAEVPNFLSSRPANWRYVPPSRNEEMEQTGG